MGKMRIITANVYGHGKRKVRLALITSPVTAPKWAVTLEHRRPFRGIEVTHELVTGCGATASRTARTWDHRIRAGLRP